MAPNAIPTYIAIMDAYDNGDLSGPQSGQAIAEAVGKNAVIHVSRGLLDLGFEKSFSPEGGYGVYHPPKRPRSRGYQWPMRCVLMRRMIKRGDTYPSAYKTLLTFGEYATRLALDNLDKNGLHEESTYPIALMKSNEINSLNAKKAEEVITLAELAEALRESPNMPKEGLLNRARGLVKAATRKGNWQDHRPPQSTN